MDASQLETTCLKLAELPEALAIVQASEEARGSSGGKGKLVQRLDVNVYPAVRVISDIIMTDQLNVPGPNLSNAEVRTCMQSWTSGKLAAFATRATSTAIGPEIELEDEVQEFEPNQDAGMRQVLSVHVDVTEVRSLRPSTPRNSMDVGRREGSCGVIDTAARYTVASRAWDRA